MVLLTDQGQSVENNAKNQRIKEMFKETRARRKEQAPKIYELKVDRSKLGTIPRATLVLLFLEAK